MKKLLSVLIMVAMLSAILVPFSVSAVIPGSDNAYASETETAPTIDGEVDEVWANAPEYVVGRIVKKDSLDATKRDSSRVTFRVLHKDNLLYFLIDITDDFLADNGNGTHWKNDCLMIFISENCNATGFGSNQLSYQPYVIVEETAEPQQLMNRGGTYVSFDEDSKYMVNFVEGGETGAAYHAQIEIQLKLNDSSLVENGNKIGIDFQYNDADSTDTANNNRTVVWGWAADTDDGPNQWKDGWGHLLFVEATASIFDHDEEWRYMTATNDPAAVPVNWNNDLSVSAEWSVAAAPFGKRAPMPTNAWGAVDNTTETGAGDGTDTNGYLWAVKSFTLSAKELAALEGLSLMTSAFYDQDITVYVNGIQLYQHSGENSLYRTKKLAEKATDVLKEGENIVAVSLHQFAGGYEFDMDLYATNGDTTKYTAQTTFESLTLGENNYDLYYQTRDNEDGTKDYRVIIMAKTEWVHSLASMEVTVTFSGEGQDDVTLTESPSVVYKSVTAPNTVYTAEDGTVIFGWIITGVPAEYQVNAPTASVITE